MADQQEGEAEVSSNALIEELAKAAVMTDTRDLLGLVGLQEQFQQLSREIDGTELQPLVDVADRAAQLLEDIVLRQVEDADAALDLVRQCVGYAQDAVAAAEQGKPLAAFNLLLFDGDDQSPDALAESLADDADLELLQEWISECELSLESLEGEVVAIESTDDPSEVIAEIRRKIHTFKGECGVLSLNVAQKLCHEAESAIDEADSDGRPFPVDAILGLIDWMKGYVSQLADDPRAKAPAHEDLLRQLAGNRCAEPTSDDPTPTTGPSASEAREDVDDDGPVDLPSDLDSEENLGDFLCEAREHIAAAEQALLGLEDNFQEIELINTVFRAFHTIKGVAGFMNLTAIVKLAHSAEALLDRARNNRITLNSAYLDLILNSCDMLLELIGALEGAPSPTKRAPMQRSSADSKPQRRDAISSHPRPIRRYRIRRSARFWSRCTSSHPSRWLRRSIARRKAHNDSAIFSSRLGAPTLTL